MRITSCYGGGAYRNWFRKCFHHHRVYCWSERIFSVFIYVKPFSIIYCEDGACVPSAFNSLVSDIKKRLEYRVSLNR